MGFEDIAGPGDDEGKGGKGGRKIELAYVHATFAPEDDDSSRGSEFAATTNNENGRLEVIKNEQASDGMTISEIKSEDHHYADDQDRGGDSDEEPEDADDSAQREGDSAEEDILSSVATELSKARQEEEDNNDEFEPRRHEDEDQEDATKDESSLLEGEQMDPESEDILDKNEESSLKDLDSVTSLTSS